jgi:hypothetical protein
MFSLHSKQIRVSSTTAHQLIMCATFENSRVLQDIDAVCEPRCRKPVTNENGRSTCGQLVEFLKEFVFRLSSTLSNYAA